MSKVMETLRDLHLKGIGLEFGKVLFFFEGGTMATVEPDAEPDGTLNGDVSVTLGRYEEEPEQKLFKLLKEFLDREDEEPCRIDHNGWCQEHLDSPPCLIVRARKMVSDA